MYQNFVIVCWKVRLAMIWQVTGMSDHFILIFWIVSLFEMKNKLFVWTCIHRFSVFTFVFINEECLCELTHLFFFSSSIGLEALNDYLMSESIGYLVCIYFQTRHSEFLKLTKTSSTNKINLTITANLLLLNF